MTFMPIMTYITLFLAAVSGIESRSISITQPSLRMLKPQIQQRQQYTSVSESYVENMLLPPPPPMFTPSSQSQYTNKLIGSDPATWSPTTNKHVDTLSDKLTEPMLVMSKEDASVTEDHIYESKNINDIFAPIKDCINNTKIEAYIKEQDIDFSDIINLNALVLFQYIKDIIHSTNNFGDSDDLTDLVIVVAKDIKDYKSTRTWNNVYDYNNIYYDYSMSSASHKNDYL